MARDRRRDGGARKPVQLTTTVPLRESLARLARQKRVERHLEAGSPVPLCVDRPQQVAGDPLRVDAGSKRLEVEAAPHGVAQQVPILRRHLPSHGDPTTLRCLQLRFLVPREPQDSPHRGDGPLRVGHLSNRHIGAKLSRVQNERAAVAIQDGASLGRQVDVRRVLGACPFAPHIVVDQLKLDGSA